MQKINKKLAAAVLCACALSWQQSCVWAEEDDLTVTLGDYALSAAAVEATDADYITKEELPLGTVSGNGQKRVSIAIGDDSRVITEKSSGIAIGDGARVTGDGYSIAIGGTSTVNKGFAVAIGYTSFVEGESGVAVGYMSSANGKRSVALGSRAFVGYDNSVAIGSNAKSSAMKSVSFGNKDANGTASANNRRNLEGIEDMYVNGGINFGGEWADAALNLQQGELAGVTKVNGITFADSTIGGVTFNGDGSLAITSGDFGSVADDDKAVTVGAVKDYVNAAIGDIDTSNYITKEELPLGKVESYSKESIAIGKNSSVRATQGKSVALGDGSVITGKGSAVAVGTNATIYNGFSVAVGYGSYVKNENGIAVGYNSSAVGKKSVAIGSNATVETENSVALGNGATASADKTVSFGNQKLNGTMNANSRRNLEGIEDMYVNGGINFGGEWADAALNLQQGELAGVTKVNGITFTDGAIGGVTFAGSGALSNVTTVNGVTVTASGISGFASGDITAGDDKAVTAGAVKDYVDSAVENIDVSGAVSGISDKVTKLETATGELKTVTDNLQTDTANLKTTTDTLQTDTAKLKTATETLTQDTSTLKNATDNLQMRTGNLEAKAQTLQKATDTLSNNTKDIAYQEGTTSIAGVNRFTANGFATNRIDAAVGVIGDVTFAGSGALSNVTTVNGVTITESGISGFASGDITAGDDKAVTAGAVKDYVDSAVENIDVSGEVSGITDRVGKLETTTGELQQDTQELQKTTASLTETTGTLAGKTTAIKYDEGITTIAEVNNFTENGFATSNLTAVSGTIGGVTFTDGALSNVASVNGVTLQMQGGSVLVGGINLNELQNNIGSITGDLTGLKDLAKTVAQHNSDIEKLQQGVSDLNKEMAAVNENIGNMQNDIDNVKEDVGKLDEKIEGGLGNIAGIHNDGKNTIIQDNTYINQDGITTNNVQADNVTASNVTADKVVVGGTDGVQTVVDGNGVNVSQTQDGVDYNTSLNGKDMNMTSSAVKTEKDEKTGASVTTTTTNSTTAAGGKIEVSTVTETASGETTTTAENKVTIENGDIALTQTDAEGNTDTRYVGQEFDRIDGEINNIHDGMNSMGRSIKRLGKEVDEVGALSAALAGLHPTGENADSRSDFAMALGSYDGEQAIAVGGFYRPDRRTLLSLGASTTSSRHMFNLGASFALDKMPKKAAVSSEALAMVIERLNKVEAENAAMQKRYDELSANYEELKAKYGIKDLQ